MKKRVLLLSPPLDRHIIWDPFRISQPLGLGYIGEALRRNGHDVKLIDCASNGFHTRRIFGEIPDTFKGKSFEEIWFSIQEDFCCLSPREFRLKYLEVSDRCFWRIGMIEEQILSLVNNFSPDLIGISCIASVNHESMIDLAREIRKYDDIPIIVGGSNVTALPDVVLEDSDGSIDYAICGEAELIINQIVENYHNRAIIRNMPGIAYLDEYGKVCINSRNDRIDLNKYLINARTSITQKCQDIDYLNGLLC